MKRWEGLQGKNILKVRPYFIRSQGTDNSTYPET